MKEHSVFWPFDRFWTEAERWIRKSRLPEERAMVGTRVTETAREVIAVVEIPGLYKRHDLDIRVAENRLVIRGKTGSETRRDGGNRPSVSVYQRSEMSFFVDLPLPASADASRMKTELKGNALIVRFPKGSSVD